VHFYSNLHQLLTRKSTNLTKPILTARECRFARGTSMSNYTNRFVDKVHLQQLQQQLSESYEGVDYRRPFKITIERKMKTEKEKPLKIVLNIFTFFSSR
jgi:hypothetical protein